MASSALTHTPAEPAAAGGPRSLSILLYSDDITTRDSVRAAVGRRPSKQLRVDSWRECATMPAVIEAVENGSFDLLILDGESSPGGMGLCRQLKNEIYQCPPVLLLTGRPQDVWLAAWSLADAAVSQPIDALDVCAGVEQALAGGS